MGLPALLNTLSELDQEVVEATTAGGAQAPIEVLLEQAKKIERVLARIRPVLAEMFAEIEESVKLAGAGGQVYIDQAIEQLGAREAVWARQLLPMIEAVRKLRAQTFSARNLSRDEKTRQVLVLERQAKAMGAVLSLMRDERWHLVALRAEIEPAGDAPVFGDPRQLLEYLQANRK